MPEAPGRILLVDDDPSLCQVLQAHLQREGFSVEALTDPAEGRAALASEPYDLFITDIKMEGIDGLDLLREAKRITPSLPVIMITGHATVETAVESMKLGAFDYVTKPVSREELLHIVRNALRLSRLEEENALLRRELTGRYGFDQIVSRGEGMRRVLALMEKVVESDATVLLTGESGTGKELVARALHFGGPRAARHFVAVNCAAVPEALVESELFGHARGAFTGAVRDRVGKFQWADGGTLFLDEIADLRPDIQAKLLRVLQDGEVHRLGDNRPTRVDARVIAATNRDIEAAMREGWFREDLYYRLAVFPIPLPPLRERREDILPLIDHFIARAVGEAERPAFTAEALAALEAYAWPGNVRELQNVVERALLLREGARMGRDLLPPAITAAARSPGGLPFPLPEDGLDLRRLEREIIRKALEKSAGNQSRAARYLGITRPTLVYRCRKYKIPS